MILRSNSAFHRRILTWTIIGIYLVIRIGLVSVSRVITHMQSSDWIDAVYQLSAYLLVLLLVCINYNCLPKYNIDRLALFLLIAGMLLNTLLRKLKLPFPVPSTIDLSVVHAVIAVSLLAFVLAHRSMLKSLIVPSMAYIVLAFVVGLLGATVTGFLIRTTQPSFLPQHATVTQLALLPVQQFSYAALSEEPFFRGFLWGALREAGFKDRGAFVVQALLFWLAHIYYLGTYPLSFWFIVPLGAVLFGLLIWFSKSLSTSLIAHGLMNGVGQAIAFYTL
jgi:membrane protease YdiL (CAAX protease family)